MNVYKYVRTNAIIMHKYKAPMKIQMKIKYILLKLP